MGVGVESAINQKRVARRNLASDCAVLLVIALQFGIFFAWNVASLASSDNSARIHSLLSRYTIAGIVLVVLLAGAARCLLDSRVCSPVAMIVMRISFVGVACAIWLWYMVLLSALSLGVYHVAS